VGTIRAMISTYFQPVIPRVKNPVCLDPVIFLTEKQFFYKTAISLFGKELWLVKEEQL
jgi:hypothetical protein